jgi:hypothetical protein
LVAAFAWAFIAQRRRKANQERSHHIVLLDRFPVVHVPVEIDREGAEEIANMLQSVYTAAWNAFADIYKKHPGPMPIDTIGMAMSPAASGHPHVVWFMPTGKMRLRVQDPMYHYFVGELHNMFRYRLHGTQWIYKGKSKADKKFIAKAQRWIDSHYPKGD